MNFNKRILLATMNKGKVDEIAPFFIEKKIDIINLETFGEDPGFKETGETFEANAQLKALHYHKLHGLPTIADDSGLVIDALNGEPGVHSSRYLGSSISHKDKMAHILKRMEGLPVEKRRAHFACSIALACNDDIYCTITKKVFGYITEKISGSGGFGYDPIFFCPELNCTFGQATNKEKSKVSHRGKAIKSLLLLFKTQGSLMDRI